MTTEPRAWIGCLAAYNAGTLHGRWVSLDCEDSLAEQCDEILKTSPEGAAEELWVMDHEGLPIDGECSPAEALRYGLLVTRAEEHGIYPEVLAHALDVLAADDDAVIEYCEEVYAGTARTAGEWAEQFTEDTGQLPEGPLANYIDWDAYARDLELSGDLAFIDGGDGVIAVWNR